MSDILNPLGGRFIGSSGPVATTSVLGTVSDPPRGLRQVDPGTIIKGVVLGRESDGLTAIATDKGTVRVAANIPLPPGAQVTLEVRPTGDRLQVLILSNEAITRSAQNTAPATPQPATANPPPSAGPSPPSTGAPAPPGVETRPAPTTPAPQPPPRTEPSIEFVGSSLRAVVVQTAPAPPPATPPAPPSQAQTPPVPVPPGSVPAPVTSSTPVTPSPVTPSPVTPPPVQVSSVPTGNIPLPNVPIDTAAPQVPLTVAAPTAIPAATLANAATVQAALLVAGAEKKDKPIVTLTPSGQIMAREGISVPYPTDLPDVPGTASPAIGMPVESALTADAKQRILALFAAADAMPDLAVDEIKPAGSRPAQASQPLPPGAELKLRVLAVQMQPHQQIAIDPIALDPHDARGQVIFGRVVSVTPAGHAVIHTPVGDIMLQNRSALVPGAQLALAIDTLESAAPVAMPTPVVQTPQQALLTFSQGWPTLADLVALLQGTSPDATRAAIDADIAHQALAMLPHAGIRLGAGLMGAMAALRGGDLAKLLGPLLANKGIGNDREELVKRLKGEFAQLSALAQDRPEVDWRALFLPVIDDQGRVTQINLFYRRSKKNDADPAERGGGTRFVVEADFSRLGPFQLDGLMRPQRFDLMVRSRVRLTDRMRREIEAIYEEARGLTGFAGSIAFQTVAEFPVIPLDEMKRSTPTVMV
ncbi:MAG: hypothetical protein HYU58_06640 [Proteobacteria bacterium]|nr:hypothetical protein [Pseudomonadota bacterium]